MHYFFQKEEVMGLIGKKTKQLSHRNEQSVQVSSSADNLGEKHNTVI